MAGPTDSDPVNIAALRQAQGPLLLQKLRVPEPVEGPDYFEKITLNCILFKINRIFAPLI